MTANATGYNNVPPFYTALGQASNGNAAQNPAIVPALGVAVGGNGDTMSLMSNAAYLAANPRLPASCTVTVGGSVTVGDTAYLSVVCPCLPGGALTVATQAVSGDTTSTLATRLAAAINSNLLMNAAGITATVASAVVTLSWPGPIGNLSAAYGWSLSNKETATVGGTVTTSDVLSLSITAPFANCAEVDVSGTPVTGDVVSITFFSSLLGNGQETVSYTVQVSDTAALIATGLSTAIGSDTMLGVLGITKSVAGASLFLNWTAGGGVNLLYSVVKAATEVTAVTLATYSNTLTFSGSTTTGDVISVEFWGEGAFSPRTVNYTVVSGDSTLTLLATHVAAAIAADATLALGGITATATGAVVTVTWGHLVPSMIGMTASAAGVGTEALAINSPPAAVTVSYTAQVSDTTSLIATGLTAAINANAILIAAGIAAVASAAVVAIYSSSVVPTAFAKALSVGATETITLAAASTAATFTIGGSVTTGDKVTLSVASPLFPTLSVAYKTVVSDTTTTIATALTALLNASGLANLGFVATSSSAVITLRGNGGTGPVTIAETLSAGATETVTLAQSTGSETFTVTAFAGGSGPIIPAQNFTYSSSGSGVYDFLAGKPAMPGFNTLSDLVRDGAAIA